MRVTFASEPAPGHPNEDLVVAGQHFAAVLDGATAGTGPTGCAHDVRWLVRTLGAALAGTLVAEPDVPLADALADAIGGARRAHGGGCDLDHPDSPSTTVAIVRERPDAAAVDYLVLADSPVLFETVDGRVRPVLDERIARLPSRTVEAVRRSRNTEGGFWVASTVPEAAYRAVSGSVPRRNLAGAALLSDGASRLVERFGLCSWKGLVELLRRTGPQGVIERVRAAESGPAVGPAGGKRHDDATVVLCGLGGPGGPGGKA